MLVQLQICTSCSFIQTNVPFPDSAIQNLYLDYRSDSYNLERIRYEPGYASIAALVGGNTQEVQVRRAGPDPMAKGQIELENDFSMLDYGGADGTFLPSFEAEKYVFEISNIAPAEGIVRIADESALSSYSYVQIAHVLEHVSYPLSVTTKAATLLRSGGCLYIAVPQELSDNEISDLQTADPARALPIHEHINQYCAKSVTAVLTSAGLSVLVVESEALQLGWTKATIIRGLGQKI